MADWHDLSDEELTRRGRVQLRHGHYALASEILSAYCSRMIAQDRAIGASVMAGYGLAIGMTGDLEEGLATCQRALSTDRRNPDIWAALARLIPADELGPGVGGQDHNPAMIGRSPAEG